MLGVWEGEHTAVPESLGTVCGDVLITERQKFVTLKSKSGDGFQLIPRNV